MANEVYNAGLNDGLRKNGINGFRKTLQTIDDRDENILGPASLQFVDDAEPAELVYRGRDGLFSTLKWERSPSDHI